jgi:hypothetical protein
MFNLLKIVGFASIFVSEVHIHIWHAQPNAG